MLALSLQLHRAYQAASRASSGRQFCTIVPGRACLHPVMYLMSVSQAAVQAEFVNQVPVGAKLASWHIGLFWSASKALQNGLTDVDCRSRPCLFIKRGQEHDCQSVGVDLAVLEHHQKATRIV